MTAKTISAISVVLNIFVLSVQSQLFMVGPEAVSRQDAVMYCDSIGGFLATISDSAEQDLAIQECGGNDACWIGLTRNSDTDTYQWEDGPFPVPYGFSVDAEHCIGNEGDPWQYWAVGYCAPYKSDSECFIVVSTPGSAFGFNFTTGWKDVGCDVMHFPLCFVPSEAPTTITKQPSKAPTGDDEYEGDDDDDDDSDDDDDDDDNIYAAAGALPGGNNIENDENTLTEHVVINFSKSAAMNIFAIVCALIVVCGVIAYCFCVRNVKKGKAEFVDNV